MLFVLAFFSELLLLFLLSKAVTRMVSLLLYRVTHSKTVTISLLALLFFPGTLLHELAHFLMAGILFVPVGDMELMPKIEGQNVKLGSVAIARTDPIRRFLIGAAPFLFGTSLLLGILFSAAQNHLLHNPWMVLLIGYAAFEIGNTMFSSKKDMEGALELFGVLAFFVVLFYFLGVRLPAVTPTVLFANPIVLQVFQQGSLFLLIPLVIDLLLLLLLKIFRVY